MNSRKTIISLVLAVVIIGLAWWLVRIIMAPIEFKEIQERRYAVVINRLEQIRDAQQAYKQELGNYADSFDKLLAFVDTGRVRILERKDSTFKYYDKTYQQDMDKDTVIIKVLGFKPVKEFVFNDATFDAEKLRFVPFTEQKHEITLGAGVIERNNIKLPVFEASAPDKFVFEDKMEAYGAFVKKDYALTIGSLTEPTLSGNWK